MLKKVKFNKSVSSMISRFIFLLILLLSISFSKDSYAQTKLTAKEAEGKKDEADKYFKKLQYLQALDIYKEIEKFYSKSALVNFRLGVCYLKTHEKKKALAYLTNSSKMGQNIDYIDPNYCYARAFHYLHDFDNAIKSYKKYLSLLEADGKDAAEVAKIRHLIQQCENGKKLIVQKRTDVKIDHLDSTINSPYQDVFPVISLHNDTLLFASRRIDAMEGKPNKETNAYSENIYISSRKGNGWLDAVALTGMNSNRDEAPLSFSWDGRKLFIYKVERTGEKDTWQFPYEDSTGKAFKMPIEEGPSNREEGGSLSPDGKRFYFSCDRAGGQGGMDIYYIELQANGEWSDAKNIGKPINTPYDDISPFMFSDGKTFYFSSEGHNSMGETDLFVTTLQPNGTWSQPQNMGYPINSAEEEPSICFTKDGKLAYFASIREDSYGFDDIYKITFGVSVPVAAVVHSKDSVKHTTHPAHTSHATTKTYQKGDVLDEKVSFEYNSFVISDEGKTSLDKVVELLKSNKGMKLIAYVYPSAPGKQESDPKMAEKRGQAIINYIVSKGITKDRVYLKVVETVAVKDKDKYRAVEFIVMMNNAVTAQKATTAAPPKTNLMRKD